jgi:integrase
MIPSSHTEVARLRILPDDPSVSARDAGDWSIYWQRVRERLCRDGYRPGTLRLYRHVLRDLRNFLRDRHGLHHPGHLSGDLARAYLSSLVEQNVSWSWLASVIAVLRNCFDRLGNMDLSARMVTPRRRWPLPETLHARELRLLFDALPNPRDRLLVALLAGCGLRVSEACRVRCADLDTKAATLRIEDPSGLRSRMAPVPQGLLPLLQGLAAISRASDPLLSGRPIANAAPRGLCVRQAERIVQKAGLRSGVLKRVTPTNLRSTYAHRRLLAGHNIRAVQEAMGHRSIKSTLRYQACIPPSITSPLDPESQGMVLRQMNVLLGRLATVLPAIHPTKPQAP